MAKKGWEVGPVLKNKVNSQGTLFRGGSAYSSDRRYPRGYTPERRNEVADAVVQPSITVDTSLQRTQVDDRVFHRGTQSKEYKDRKVRVSGDMSAPLVNESRQPTRDLVDNIARSTVPVHHLQGVQFRTNVDQDRLGPTAAGHYDTRGDALTKGGPVIRLGPGYEKTSTTIHEIGHHVSETQENAWKSNYGHHTTEGGQEEAFADNYADTHYRNSKGRPESKGIYGGGPYAGHIDRGPEFWDGYRANRHYLPDPHFESENAKYFRHFPEEVSHPDGSQDVPLIHREREYGGYVNGKQQKRDVLGEVNYDALPSHVNHDWSKYHG